MSEKATAPKRCQAKTKRGAQCKAPALTGGQFCFHHEPGKAYERALARSRGGRARQLLHDLEAPPVALQTAADAVLALEHALALSYRLSPGPAKVRAIVAVVTAWRAVFEVSELEERIRALEQRWEL